MHFFPMLSRSQMTETLRYSIKFTKIFPFGLQAVPHNYDEIMALSPPQTHAHKTALNAACVKELVQISRIPSTALDTLSESIMS